MIINVPSKFQKNMRFRVMKLNSLKVCATNLTKFMGETKSLNIVY